MISTSVLTAIDRSARRAALPALVALALFGLMAVDAVHAATLYKCTTAAGALVYSDRPCASAAADQEVLPMAEAADADATWPDAASISRRCQAPIGPSLAIEAALIDLPSRQREAFEAVLRGVALSGLSREGMQASTLHLDEQRTLVWCLSKARQPSVVWLVEVNGRVVELRRSGKVKVHNDANDPITLADRCSSLLGACFQPGQPGHSLDQCFAAAPVCPAGRLAPDSSCCSQSSKDAYQRERTAGVDPLTASTRALYGR